MEEGKPPMGYIGNFTSVLNTPRDDPPSLAALYDYLTTSSQDGPVQEPVPLDEITMADFDEYLARHAKNLSLRTSRLQQNSDNRQESSEDTSVSLDNIPKAYFEPHFTLLDPGVLQEAPGHTLLLERMSTMLDTVEMRLITQISKRSDDIFSTLTDFQSVNQRVQATCKQIASLRHTLNSMDSDMVGVALKVAQLRRKRANCLALEERIRLVATVAQTQATVQLLLSTSDFAGALDLLQSTQRILSDELSDIHAFKHLHAQLSEVEVAVERMMMAELVRLALNDDVSKTQLETEMIPVVLGLKRVGKLHAALQEYREKAVERVRPALRNTVLSGATDKDATASQLATVVKDQDPAEFLTLLSGLFSSLTLLIERSRVVFDVVSSFALTDADVNEALDTVSGVAEECHQRIARLLQLRDEVHSRLPFADYVRLYSVSLDFIETSEKMCHRSLRALRGPLMAQSKSFLETYHSKEMQSLSLLLDGELWQHCDVLDVFQNIIYRWSELSSSEHHQAITGTTKTLEINGKKYKLVNVCLFLIRMTDDYLRVAQLIPSLTTDVLSRMVELFKLFNSRSCQLVLGAGALQQAGLKSITATHLALVSQCLGLLIDQVPVIAIILGRMLPATHSVLLTDLDHVVEDCAHHRQEIFSKLVSIMRERVDFHCRALPKMQWDIEHEGVSPYINTLTKETVTMHKKLCQSLQGDELRKVFGSITVAMMQRIGQYIDQCRVDAPLSRRRLRIDAQYFITAIKGLKGIDDPGTDLLDRIYKGSAPVPPSKPKPRRFMDL